MILSIGTDIVKVDRIRDIIAQHPRFLTRFFTHGEQTYFANKTTVHIHAAGFFAAKEAAVKAAGGTVMNYEVVHEHSGKPHIVSRNPVVGTNLHLSISHEHEFAVAFVVYEKV